MLHGSESPILLVGNPAEVVTVQQPPMEVSKEVRQATKARVEGWLDLSAIAVASHEGNLAEVLLPENPRGKT